MNFSSIKEYFYHLQSRCYALLLLPLCFIIVYYALLIFTPIRFLLDKEEAIFLIRFVFPFLALLELTSVYLLTVLQLRKVKKMPGMGDRLDKYAAVITARMAAGVFTCFLMVVGFALTDEKLFLLFFTIGLLFIFFQRPTPERVAAQLQLKGDERELIIKGELV